MRRSTSTCGSLCTRLIAALHVHVRRGVVGVLLAVQTFT